MARRAYGAGQPVNVIALISNDSSRACTFGGSGGSGGSRGSGTSHQSIGPCGSLPMDVFDANGVDIWPGPVAYSCPLISEISLAPHGTVTATGSWPKSAVTRSSNAPAPPGTYRLEIDRAISFTITLSAPNG
jgi:hypothetical protein